MKTVMSVSGKGSLTFEVRTGGFEGTSVSTLRRENLKELRHGMEI
jgi:hypothetical protein